MHERVKEARYSRDPEELYAIGVMFRDGMEVEQDFKEAKDWFRRAAFKEHPGAQFNLGVISAKQLTGSFASDYETKSWLQKAAKHDHQAASQLLAMIEAGEDLPEAAALFAMDGAAPEPSQNPPPEPEPAPEPVPETKPDPEISPPPATAATAATAAAVPPTPPPAKPEPPPVTEEAPPPVLPDPKPEPPPPPPATTVSAPKFNKDLPMADTTYQPTDLTEYAADPWDIRISLEDAPLTDAYYFTVQDPSASNGTIQSVLENYALNPGRAGELDTGEYPQLPHIQQELLGYYQAAKSDPSQLSIYINKRPSADPVPLGDTAAQHLSTCYFHDGSFDYRLLDLVFCPGSARVNDPETDSLIDKFGALYMLFQVDFLKQNKPNDFKFNAPVFKTYLQGGSGEFPKATHALRAAADKGWIEPDEPNEQILVTDSGRAEKKALLTEVHSLEQQYEKFQSVSASPPALGVPDGFDARIQVMRRNNVDVVRAIFLFAFHFDDRALFGTRNWAVVFESGGSFAAIHDAFQYESHFTEDVIEALAQLAESN